MTSIVEFTCSVCNNKYIPYRNTQKTCSDKCRYIRSYRLRLSNNDAIKCKNCLKLFLPENKNNMFCSLRCNYDFKAKGKISTCLFCKRTFVRKNRCNRFCSRQCFFRSSSNKETYLESELYSYLHSIGIDFEKQKQVHRCIPDAYIDSMKLCIFADGIYWHNKPEVIDRDKRINKELRKLGYRVIRVGEDSHRRLDIHKLKTMYRRIKKEMKNDC